MQGIAGVKQAAGVAINGPQPIKGERFGQVTMDWPAVARVRITKIDVAKAGIHGVGPVYIDAASATSDAPATRFSDNSFSLTENTILDYWQIAKIAENGFRVVGIANLDEELFWIMPGQGASPDRQDVWAARCGNDSQEITSPILPVEYSTPPCEWMKTSPEGNMQFLLPGAYTLAVWMSVPRATAASVEVTSEIDHQVVPKIPERTSQSAYWRWDAWTGVAEDWTLRQAAQITGLDCSGGYGACPKLNVSWPAVGKYTVNSAMLFPPGGWEAPLEGKLAEAEPIFELPLERVTASYAGQQLPHLSFTIIISRQPIWAQDYRGTWGWGGWGARGGWNGWGGRNSGGY